MDGLNFENSSDGNLDFKSPSDSWKFKPQKDIKYPYKNDLNKALKSKTSLRMKYEAEMKVLRVQIGSLEEIRGKLGLSRRKMGQLLMVDPSAWTRWTRNEDKVPPHIYRSLQWYMALIDKKPEFHPQNTFQSLRETKVQEQMEVDRLKSDFEAKIKRIKQEYSEQKWELEEQIEDMRKKQLNSHSQVQQTEQVQIAWKMLVLVNTIFVAIGLVLYILN